MISLFKDMEAPPTYQELRACARALHAKCHDTPVARSYDLLRCARRLGVPINGRTLLFDGEGDMNALMDFYYHEFRVDGKTLVQQMDAAALGLSSLETSLLRAVQQARTSLYFIKEAQPDRQQVVLQDVLEQGRPDVALTDISLSQSAAGSGAEILLFVRVVSVAGINMSSGLFFVFPAYREEGLLDAFWKRTKKTAPADLPEERFRFFYEKNRQIGEPQAYADALPAASA